MVEIHREDLSSLPKLLSVLRESQRKFILFCDDLSFDADDTTYKSLKAMLEGGIEADCAGYSDATLEYGIYGGRHLLQRGGWHQ